MYCKYFQIMRTGDTMRYYWTKDLVDYSMQNETLLSTEIDNNKKQKKKKKRIEKKKIQKETSSQLLLSQSVIIVYLDCQQDTLIHDIISGNYINTRDSKY